MGKVMVLGTAPKIFGLDFGMDMDLGTGMGTDMDKDSGSGMDSDMDMGSSLGMDKDSGSSVVESTRLCLYDATGRVTSSQKSCGGAIMSSPKSVSGAT